MNEHRQSPAGDPDLPRLACLPVNRCNLPSRVLGSLAFQKRPADLQIDGVKALHGKFFRQLDALDDAGRRAAAFRNLMRDSLFLDRPADAGSGPGQRRLQRENADYLRILRGWMFDADSQEAAVLKSWVETRFGLLPRNHRGALGDFRGENYQAYLSARSRGLYNTNALEWQLDMLYTYSQYELARRHPDKRHLRLYRGVNRLEDHDVLGRPDPDHWILLLNNLNSFTLDPHRAGEFGDHVFAAPVPLSKILFFPELLPGSLRGEQEHLVIGGLYHVEKLRSLP